MKTGYFESLGGNKSSSRLIGFIVVLIALLETFVVLYLGKNDIVQAAIAAGTLFITIAGPAMAFLLLKNEQKQNKNYEKFNFLHCRYFAHYIQFNELLYQRERTERIRVEHNQTALLENVQRYKTSDSLNVLSNQKLTFSLAEFKKYNTELTETVDKLNLKVKRLQSITSTATSTTTDIHTQIKDSIVYVPVPGTDLLIRDTLKCIDYIDPYLSLNGCIVNDLFDGLIESRDTIDQFVHRVPRKFLFIRWGTKAIKQEILSRNPHTTIEYSKYIELKKRKR